MKNLLVNLLQLYHMLLQLSIVHLIGGKRCPQMSLDFKLARRQHLLSFPNNYVKMLSNLSKNSNIKIVFLK